jgi:hypothetical protein
MSQDLIYPILFIVVGGVNLFYSIKFLKDPKFAEDYIKTSSKAWLWRKMFGVEKSIKITKRVFAPLGILVGIGFVVFGIILFLL